jgi:hypothetical protein
LRCDSSASTQSEANFWSGRRFAAPANGSPAFAPSAGKPESPSAPTRCRKHLEIRHLLRAIRTVLLAARWLPREKAAQHGNRSQQKGGLRKAVCDTILSPTEPSNGEVLMFRNRLCPEILEDRNAPSTFATTVTIVSAGPAYYSTTTQTETVTAQAMYTNGTLQVPVPAGTTINITDGGQVLSVQTDNNGQASATFCFSLFPFQELPHAHGVSAQVPLQTFPFTSDILLQSTNSNNTAQAPDTNFAFLFQILYDDYLVLNGYDISAYN